MLCVASLAQDAFETYFEDVEEEGAAGGGLADLDGERALLLAAGS